MFHRGPGDGRKSESSGEASRDGISNQAENGIPEDQNLGAKQIEENGKKCSKCPSSNQSL